MKKLIKIALVVALVLGLALEALAAPSVVDEAKLLTPTQVQQLTQLLNQEEQKHGVTMAVVTKQSLPNNMKAGKFANQLLDTDYTKGPKGNMVLVLNMGTRDWYVATDKKAKALISEAGIEQIGKNIVPALKSKDYKTAFSAYAVKSDELLTYYEKNGKPLGGKEEGSNWLMHILGALGLGGVASFIYGKSLEASMSNVAQAKSARDYLDEDSVALAPYDDTFLYMEVTRVAKEKTVTESSEDEDHGGGGGKF